MADDTKRARGQDWAQAAAMEDHEAVIRDLRRLHRDINELLDALGGKRSLQSEEKLWLQDLMRGLKGRLLEAAKRRPQSAFQLAYLEPAVRSAASKLRVAVNSHPIDAKWFALLYGMRTDVADCLSGAEMEFACGAARTTLVPKIPPSPFQSPM
jgi:hypothetical protein